MEPKLVLASVCACWIICCVYLRRGKVLQGLKHLMSGSHFPEYHYISLTDVGFRYSILSRIIEEGLAGPLYKRLTMQVIVPI